VRLGHREADVRSRRANHEGGEDAVDVSFQPGDGSILGIDAEGCSEVIGLAGHHVTGLVLGLTNGEVASGTRREQPAASAVVVSTRVSHGTGSHCGGMDIIAVVYRVDKDPVHLNPHSGLIAVRTAGLNIHVLVSGLEVTRAVGGGIHSNPVELVINNAGYAVNLSLSVGQGINDADQLNLNRLTTENRGGSGDDGDLTSTIVTALRIGGISRAHNLAALVIVRLVAVRASTVSSARGAAIALFGGSEEDITTGRQDKDVRVTRRTEAGGIQGSESHNMSTHGVPVTSGRTTVGGTGDSDVVSGSIGNDDGGTVPACLVVHCVVVASNLGRLIVNDGDGKVAPGIVLRKVQGLVLDSVSVSRNQAGTGKTRILNDRGNQVDISESRSVPSASPVVLAGVS